MDLEQKIEQSYRVLDSLPVEGKYILAFSGGKDSHVVLGVYLSWCQSRSVALDIKAVFSDTGLEAPKLYGLINSAEVACKSKGLEFIQTKPDISKSYWVTQFGMGYPVPTHRNRWCTTNLKVRPIQKVKGIPITGVHKGESSKRDKRLNSCATGECGISDISNGVEPIREWRNCDVWDYITIYLDDVLYQGACDNIMSLYEISESQTGSLRMGCIMCPVVSEKRIRADVKKGISPSYATELRAILEKLRSCRRIASPNKVKKDGTPVEGAIYIEDRRKVWEDMKELIPFMLTDGFITEAEVYKVEELLQNNTYPPTYKPEWIRLASLPFQ